MQGERSAKEKPKVFRFARPSRSLGKETTVHWEDADKAYLPSANIDTESGATALEFGFGGEVTGIDTAEMDGLKVQYFDLLLPL